MFTLSHHVVVQYAHTLAGGRGFFTGYRLLGDDIVITDTRVATKYQEIMSTLGVEISPSKTHISQDVYEMAKR
jgi:hypothetical protein